MTGFLSAFLAVFFLAVPALAEKDPVSTFFRSVAIAGADPVAYFKKRKAIVGVFVFL